MDYGPAEVLATYYDTLSAEVLVQFLLREGIPAEVRSDAALFGAFARCEVVVPTDLLRKAHWLMATADFSQSELTYYATGEVGADADNGTKS
jgi:hypothetical protein